MFYVTGTNDKAAPAPSKPRTSAGTSCKHFDVICIPSPANETHVTLCKQQKDTAYTTFCVYSASEAQHEAPPRTVFGVYVFALQTIEVLHRL